MAINVLIQLETSWCNNNQSVDKYLAKEVQATLPLTFYIYIFDEIDSRYHKYFRADLFTAPPQVYTYRLTNTSYNFAMISTFPNQNEILGIPHIKKQPKQGGFLECESISDVNCLKMSAPSIHASLPKNTIFLYPETLSCLDHERVGASDLLKREEVEVGQLVPGEVEVLPYPGVPVVPHCPPVLCAPLPARPSVAHLAHILTWLP